MILNSELSLRLSNATLLDNYWLNGGVLRHSVLNLHYTVVKLCIIVLFDSRGRRASLVVDQSGRAEILSEHILVEICVNQDAALGEELVKVGNGHSVRIDVADLELALSESSLGRLLLLAEAQCLLL